MYTFDHLPHEIIANIADHLSSKERSQCAVVCRAWHTEFSRALYRTISLQTRWQLRTLLRTFHQSKLGHLVRELNLGGLGLSRDEFEALPELCSCLEILQFHWSLWKKIGYYNEAISHFKSLKGIQLHDAGFATYVLLRLGRQLTHLQLCDYPGDTLYRGRLMMLLLKLTRNLTHLTISGRNHFVSDSSLLTLSVDQVRELHSICPALQSLSLSNLNFLPMQHNDCDDEEEDGLPQLTMRTLRLDFFEFEDHGWISYFARKYPCLTTLDWQFRLANVITPSHLLERAEDTKNAFMSIPQHCRQLQSLTFKNLEEGFWPGKEFFEGMGGLHTIQLMFSTTIPDRRGMTKEVFDAMLQQNQAALSVLHIPVWLNARVADMLQSIGRCSHLVELELANDDYRSFFSREIDLDMLLGHCKRLKRLTLIRGAVVVGPGYSVQPYPSLTQLALILVRFSPDVFSYLSKRCPNLCDMRIRNCSWISPDPNLTINMPNHAFNTFKIEQVSRLQENGGFHIGYEATIVKLTLLDKIQNIRRRRKMAIEEASLARWYHLHIAENLSRIPLVLGRLQPRQIAELHMYRGMAMPTNLPQRSTPHARRKEWIYDIPYGYIAIRCKSINRFTMDIITLKY